MIRILFHPLDPSHEMEKSMEGAYTIASIFFDSVSAVVINALRKHKCGKQRLTLPT